MKKIIDSLKKIFKTSNFKAGFWATVITILMFIPFIILAATILLQSSYITKLFWFTIFVMIIIFILIINFSNVIYAKLLDNYENKEEPKKKYLKIFVNELLGPFGIGLFTAFMIIYLDQLSKIVAITKLEPYDTVVFIKGLLNFELAFNKGAAWSICSGHTDILALISLIATFVLLYFMKDFNLKKKTLYSLAIAFILGGTAGNMIDRFFRAAGVVDFIEFGFIDFPIFNIADSFLVVGTIILAVSIIFHEIITAKKNKEQIEKEEENQVEENIVDTKGEIHD